MIGHLVTVGIFAIAGLVALELVGVDPVFAISSAGFIGIAAARLAQHNAHRRSVGRAPLGKGAHLDARGGRQLVDDVTEPAAPGARWADDLLPFLGDAAGPSRGAATSRSDLRRLQR